MQLSTLVQPALEYVVANMREWDRREIFATRMPGREAESLCEAVMAAGPVSWIGYYDDEPVTAFGCAPMWPGVWSMWLFATDKFQKIGMGVTKLAIRHIVPMLWEGGAHRLQCHSMEGHVEAQRWLEVIGARRETTLRNYGRDGQDFHVYAWERG